MATGGRISSAAGQPAAQVKDSQPEKSQPARRNRIAVSTYSFWRFRRDSKLPIEKCIDLAAEMGFDGVEL